MRIATAPDTDLLLKHAASLPLARLGPEEDAGLWIASVPWPRAKTPAVSIGGIPTYVKALGQWPNQPRGTPRRLLMVADGGGSSPPQTKLGSAAKSNDQSPTARAELFAKCEEPGFAWERHLLRLKWGGKSIGLAMGLRHAGEVHWWESCRLVVLEETPTCRVIEMAGAIPRRLFHAADLTGGYNNPFLHNHNWINGHIYARLHSNGVCEVFGHHVNSRFFDDGKDLEDVVPVLGIVSDIKDDELAQMTGPWTGEQQSLDLAGVKFDLTEVARLATPYQAGHLGRDGKFLVLQPYEGVDLYSGVCALDRTGDPFIYHSTQRIFPRGMARTLRFSLSLNPQRSPRVVRYQAPSWWYGLCEELMPEPLLPVSNEYDNKLDACRRFVNKYILRGGFEDGTIPRGGNKHPGPKDRGRSEASWEGEAPYGMFLLAWLSGSAEDHTNALRMSYAFTDIAVDHATKMVRMHGYPGGAFALPMNRVLACVAAWLETGDAYPLDAAKAVVDNSHWTQKNSWPRLAVGRDAKYVRGAVMLYRYTGDEHYKEIAHEGSIIAAESQRENGSFGDQAGGTGIHQWGAYITKPWMGLMCTEGVVDYLEVCGNDDKLNAMVKRWGAWLMKNRFKHDNGVVGWSYQHDFKGKKLHPNMIGPVKWSRLPSPGIWHQDTLARFMMVCALMEKDGSFVDAWAESFVTQQDVGGDHGMAASSQYLPWLSAKLWNATIDENGVTVRPVSFGKRTPKSAKILSPSGAIDISWDAKGKVKAPHGVNVVLHGSLDKRKRN
jgi:hypothetical protein